MKEYIKTNRELVIEGQKEQRRAELFNKCMQLMNAHYRKTHPVSA